MADGDNVLPPNVTEAVAELKAYIDEHGKKVPGFFNAPIPPASLNEAYNIDRALAPAFTEDGFGKQIESLMCKPDQRTGFTAVALTWAWVLKTHPEIVKENGGDPQSAINKLIGEHDLTKLQEFQNWLGGHKDYNPACEPAISELTLPAINREHFANNDATVAPVFVKPDTHAKGSSIA